MFRGFWPSYSRTLCCQWRKQFQLSIGRKIEFKIVWLGQQRGAALPPLNINTCLTSRRENGEHVRSAAPNTERQREKPDRSEDMCSEIHWLCQHARARTHFWKIKWWTGDWEQNRHFLSPFSFEFTWTRQVREVKQILPSPSDVPLRGVGLDAGGVPCKALSDSCFGH